MKPNRLLFGITLLLTIALNHSCQKSKENKVADDQKPNTVSIYNYSNQEELDEYNQLNLDESHPNLLNPEISKSDYNAAVESWTELHQQIGSYLSKNSFSWGVDEKTISIVQKIYFEPNGQISRYFFRVLNQDVTKETKEQFARLISDFAKTHSIDFQLDHKFAQCGKTKYSNE